MHDKLAIRDTIERFHDAVNQRKPNAIAALFTAHGVWEVAPPFEHRYEGKSAIEAGVTGTIGATEVLVQSCGPIVIDLVDETHAQARTSMQEFGRFHSRESMHVAGTYYDELEREEDGAWRFTHRRFVAHYADELPVPGRVLLSAAGSHSADARAGLAEQQMVASVIASFGSAISARDFAAATALFAEDAEWSSDAGPLSFRQQGRAQIGAFLANSVASAEALYYLVGAPSVTLDGRDRATSRVSIVELLHVKASGERKLLLGTYLDELTKVAGSWQFSKRHVTVSLAETLR